MRNVWRYVQLTYALVYAQYLVTFDKSLHAVFVMIYIGDFNFICGCVSYDSHVMRVVVLQCALLRAALFWAGMPHFVRNGTRAPSMAVA
jgi:hypothetical protein